MGNSLLVGCAMGMDVPSVRAKECQPEQAIQDYAYAVAKILVRALPLLRN